MGFIGFWTKADFLNLDLDLGLLGLAFFLFTLVQEFAKVQYAADRGGGVWGNFHQIHFSVAGDLKRLANGHNAHIITGRTNQAHFRNPDGLINSELYFSYMRLLESNNTQPAHYGWLLSGWMIPQTHLLDKQNPTFLPW